MTDRAVAPEALKALFVPTRVTLVGASERNPLTRPMLTSLHAVGFKGDVTVVHPRGREVEGLECYSSLSEVPVPPDVVALLMGSPGVLPALEEAAHAGVRAAVVFDGGFTDAGHEGRERHAELVRLADEFGMAVLGPNCQGYLNPGTGTALYLHELNDGYDTSTGVALVVQSGGVADALVNNAQGVRWSHIITTGNEAVVDATSVLSYLIDDPACSVICLFLESIRRPREFLAECERAHALGKPVVVLKTARTAAGSKAAQAHTGAIAYPSRLMDAVLEHAPLLRADSLEDLLATVALLQSGPPVRGAGIAVVTTSGGMIELVLDDAEELNLSFPALAAPTVRKLEGVMTDAHKISNPVDLWPTSVDMTDALGCSLAALGADPELDVVIYLSTSDLPLVGSQHSGLGLDQLVTAAAGSETKFVWLDSIPGAHPEALMQRARDGGVATMSGIPTCLRALERTAAYGRRPVSRDLVEPPNLDEELVAHLVEAIVGRGPTSGTPALELMAALGVAVARSWNVASADDAADVAAQLRHPVVLKDGDPTQLHKTEAGGVVVDLRTPEDVRAAAADMSSRGATSFQVQEMVDGDHEILIGLQRSPDLGTFVVCAMGGIWTEILDDAAIRPVGLAPGMARSMLESLRGFPALAGARGPAVDVDSLVSAIERLDWFGRTHADAVEAVDLNPLMVSADGAVCVDAVVVPVEGGPQ